MDYHLILHIIDQQPRHRHYANNRSSLAFQYQIQSTFSPFYDVHLARFSCNDSLAYDLSLAQSPAKVSYVSLMAETVVLLKRMLMSARYHGRLFLNFSAITAPFRGPKWNSEHPHEYAMLARAKRLIAKGDRIKQDWRVCPNSQ